jgi:hypothetical protein
MAQESNNYNKLIITVIAVGIFICAFFLFDNYRDKQRVKNAINEEAIRKMERDWADAEIRRKNAEIAEIEKISSINKNLEILKTGEICKGSVKPKSHQWVFNNLTKEALLILNSSEYFSIGGIPEGVCTIDAVNENLGTIYTRYAKQSEVDKTISSVEMMSK